MSVVREGGKIGIPGLYVTADPGAEEAGAQVGNLQVPLTHLLLIHSLAHLFIDSLMLLIHPLMLTCSLVY